jgi:hypothetical protein
VRHPDPWRIDADLHSHSRSVRRDPDAGPSSWAAPTHRACSWLRVTDHDELSGLAEAAQAAAALGMGFVPGVEVSVTWAGEAACARARDRSGRQHALRRPRPHSHRACRAGPARVARQLERAGVEGAWRGRCPTHPIRNSSRGPTSRASWCRRVAAATCTRCSTGSSSKASRAMFRIAGRDCARPSAGSAGAGGVAVAG